MSVLFLGTFDNFNSNHENFLKKCLTFGNKLVIGVSTDQLVLMKTGIKPKQNNIVRLNKIKSLPYVDDAFLEKSLDERENYIKDTNCETIVILEKWKYYWADTCKEWNCKVIFIEGFNDIEPSLAPKLKLHGTYKIPPTPTNEIFPLKNQIIPRP